MATESTGARISRLVGSAKAAAVKLKLTEKSDTATAILLDGTDEETTEVLLGLLADCPPPQSMHALALCPAFASEPWSSAELQLPLKPSRRETNFIFGNVDVQPWIEFPELCQQLLSTLSSEAAVDWAAALERGSWSRRDKDGQAGVIKGERMWLSSVSGTFFTVGLTMAAVGMGCTMSFEKAATSGQSSASGSVSSAFGAPRQRVTRPGRRDTTQQHQQPAAAAEACTTEAHLRETWKLRPDGTVLHEGTRVAVAEFKSPSTAGLAAYWSNRALRSATDVRRDAMETLLADGSSLGSFTQLLTQMIGHRVPVGFLSDGILTAMVYLRRVRSVAGSYSTSAEALPDNWRAKIHLVHCTDRDAAARQPSLWLATMALLQEGKLGGTPLPGWLQHPGAVATGAADHVAAPGPAAPTAGSHLEVGSAAAGAPAPARAPLGSTLAPLQHSLAPASCLASDLADGALRLDAATLKYMVGRGHYGNTLTNEANAEVVKLAPLQAQAALAELDHERSAYHVAGQRGLQGGVLPRLLAAGDDVELDYAVLVLERVGVMSALHASPHSLRAARPAIEDAYKKLWAAGIAHGDVALRNVMLHAEPNRVSLIDLGRAVVDPSKDLLEAEACALNGLFAGV